MTPLDALASEPRWVAWRYQLRGGRPTKVPYAPQGGRARADDPGTWGTLAEAEASAAKIVNGQGGGIGIQLGDLGGDTYLAGIDLDCCLGEDSTAAPWAETILSAVPSYAEVSPSGRGLKVFFYVACRDVRQFLERIGAQHGQWGVRRDLPGEDARDHGPAIEVYLSHRYFAVTGRRWPTAPERLAMLDREGLERLVPLIPPPRYTHRNGSSTGGDNSRSAKAFSKGREYRRQHPDCTFGEWCNALRADPEIADWVREKGEAAGGRELRRIWDKVTPLNTKPIVKIVGGNLPLIIDEAEEHLLRSDRDIYQRGDFIVRPAMVPIVISDHRETMGIRLVPVKLNHLAERFTKSIDFQKFDKRSNKWISVDCPERVAATYLERIGEWYLPILAGVVTAPTLRPDGSILDKPGYDPATGILYDPIGVTFGPIPTSPSRDDAHTALQRLKSLIAEFPFIGDGSRSVALSGILTTIIRRSIPRAPLHAFTAPDAGTGKSKLIDIASIINAGHEAPAIATGKTEEEMEKRLGAALIAGDAVISIDNVTHPLGGEMLCQAITQSVLGIRILGKSEKVAITNNALFFANGNNLIIFGDAVRRAIVGFLDAGCERPELRKFKSEDPIKTAKRERPQLVHASLTILRAFHVAGRPGQKIEPLGSFEVWSGWVREALVWLGEDDPCTTMERARTEDPKLQALASVMRHWETAIGIETQLTTKQLIDRATDCISPAAEFDRRKFLYPDLREALLTVAGERNNINSARLGRWLRSVKGRVVGRKRIVLGPTLHGDNRWKLEAM